MADIAGTASDILDVVEVSELWDYIAFALPALVAILAILGICWCGLMSYLPSDRAALVQRSGRPRRLVTDEGYFFVLPFFEGLKRVYWSPLTLPESESAVISSRRTLKHIITSEQKLECEVCTVPSDYQRALRVRPVLLFRITSPSRAFTREDLPYELRSLVLTALDSGYIEEETVVSPVRLSDACNSIVDDLNSHTGELGVKCISLQLSDIVYEPQAVGRDKRPVPIAAVNTAQGHRSNAQVHTSPTSTQRQMESHTGKGDVQGQYVRDIPSSPSIATYTTTPGPITPEAVKDLAMAQAEALRILGDAHVDLVTKLQGLNASSEVLQHAARLHEAVVSQSSPVKGIGDEFQSPS